MKPNPTNLLEIAGINATALFNKIQARHPTVFPVWKVLRMATIEPTQAVGLGDEVVNLCVPCH